jgi:cytochrome b
MHWLLTLSLGLALGLAMASEGRPSGFRLHMVAGLVAAFVVLLRIVWGFVGSRHARFAAFLFGPKTLWAYLRAAVRRSDERHIGHNPGSSYAIYGMLLLTLAGTASGLGAVLGCETLGEAHEALVHVALLVVIVHLAGIVFHTIRHRENIAWSMVDGMKRGPAGQAIPKAHVVAAVLVLVLTAGWCWVLGRGYDAARGELRLPLTRRSIKLGGPDEHEHHDEGH